MALVGIALNDDDRAFIEQCCVEVEQGQPLESLLGLARLCLATWPAGSATQPASGALAEALAARAELDPADVAGRALDGLDDIRSYLHRSG